MHFTSALQCCVRLCQEELNCVFLGRTFIDTGVVAAPGLDLIDCLSEWNMIFLSRSGEDTFRICCTVLRIAFVRVFWTFLAVSLVADSFIPEEEVCGFTHFFHVLLR